MSNPLPDTAALNAQFAQRSARVILSHALSGALGRVGLVSSFGADAIVLLHMVSVVNRDAPVLFVDTGRLFSQTLDYQLEVTQQLGLTDVRVLRPDGDVLKARDAYGALFTHDPDACCAIRKTAPMDAGLVDFDGWVTGRKRFQSQTRVTLEPFERDDARIKINPLAHWTRKILRSYIAAHRLPAHPLVAKGFPSIGCAPCTTKVAPGEDPRAGRWRGQAKTECGLHVKKTAALS